MNIWSVILEEGELNQILRKIIFIKDDKGIKNKIESYFCFYLRKLLYKNNMYIYIV